MSKYGELPLTPEMRRILDQIEKDGFGNNPKKYHEPAKRPISQKGWKWRIVGTEVILDKSEGGQNG